MGLLADGWTEDAISMLLRAHRDSSARQYQGVWDKFMSFLSLRSLSAGDVTVGVVCDFLSFHAVTYERRYRTLSGYRSALRHPLLFALRIEVNGVASDLFLRGIFNYVPPVRARRMPCWSLDVLLSFLLTPPFEPLESAPFFRLVQKALCLILLASGRRIGDVCFLSRSARPLPYGQGLSLSWVPGYVPKVRTPSFAVDSPSIRRLTSAVPSDRLLCPVRAYNILLSRSLDLVEDVPLARRHHRLWVNPRNLLPASKGSLSRWFVNLVVASRHHHGLDGPVSVGPHQMRKLGASYSSMLGQDEDSVLRVMGFSSRSIFRKNYVAWVPPLTVPCMLPGGPFLARKDHNISNSD